MRGWRPTLFWAMVDSFLEGDDEKETETVRERGGKQDGGR